MALKQPLQLGSMSRIPTSRYQTLSHYLVIVIIVVLVLVLKLITITIGDNYCFSRESIITNEDSFSFVFITSH